MGQIHGVRHAAGTVGDELGRQQRELHHLVFKFFHHLPPLGIRVVQQAGLQRGHHHGPAHEGRPEGRAHREQIAQRALQHPCQILAHQLAFRLIQPEHLLLAQPGVAVAALGHVPGVDVAFQRGVAAVVAGALVGRVVAGAGVHKGVAHAVAHIVAVGPRQIGKADLPLGPGLGQAGEHLQKQRLDAVVVQIGPQVPVVGKGQPQKVISKQVRPLAPQEKGPGMPLSGPLGPAVRQTGQGAGAEHTMGHKARHTHCLLCCEEKPPCGG